MPNEVQPERERRDDLYREWNQCIDVLVSSRLTPGWKRLRMLRPLRKDGETFIIEYNEMHMDWLEHRTPELYEQLGKRCRMVKHAEQ